MSFDLSSAERQQRIAKAEAEDIPAALDYLEGQLPADGWLFGEIGIADISIATFFRNAFYAGFEIDAARWPRVASSLSGSCRARLWSRSRVKPLRPSLRSSGPRAGKRASGRGLWLSPRGLRPWR